VGDAGEEGGEDVEDIDRESDMVPNEKNAESEASSMVSCHMVG